MIGVGYWKSEREPELPDPMSLVGTYDSVDLKEKIISYLRSGNTYIQWRGLSWCRFDCDVSPYEMGSKCLSDNEWVWPEGLFHYVEAHNVILPKRFIDHMAINNWKVPNYKFDSNNSKKDHDLTFWINFGKPHN